jgi:histidinol-phosphate phosphatase family protein
MGCQVAILAGGMGSRLKSRSGDLPKPMALINGRPVLEHQIYLCVRNGFTRIALLVHYRSEKISEYFGDGSKFGAELTYVIETEARGTAGALLGALGVMDNRFLVLYGDTYADIDLKAFWDYDSQRPAAGTLLLHPNDHPQDSDLMEIDEDGALVVVHPYPHADGVVYPNLVNAALYILERDSLSKSIPLDRKTDLAKNTFPDLLAAGKKLYAYVTPEYIKDMGTPERLDKVECDINSGLPERLSGRELRAAVFFDRDGTLNLEVNHLRDPNQLILLDGVSEAVRRINRSGMVAVGITNQPVLARGDVTSEGLKKIHARLDSLLGKDGAYLDRMYVCPHHPNKGFLGEIAELKIRCRCRKPEAGLFNLAVQELNISRRDSWMVGDTTSDILAGKRAGLRTILVNTGYAGRDFKYSVDPDFIASNLADAVDWILNGHANAVEKLLPIALSSTNCRTILVGGASRSGKSTVANVLVEIFNLIGKKAHVLPLDGWLKTSEERHEGAGVLSRYKFNEIINEAKKVVSSTQRFSIEYAYHDRKLRHAQSKKTTSIGPSDIVIFEGVPALLDERLLQLANLSIYVDLGDDTRLERLKNEYVWRGEDEEFFMRKIMSREEDEVAPIKRFAHKADYQINLENSK